MPNYKNSKIYKIVCNITNETYYGSTTQQLSARLAGHRSDLKKTTKTCSAKQILLRGNYNIILCETVSCDNKEQLDAIERKWIETNNCINKIIPTRTRDEYRNDNKELLKQRKSEWYQKNKETVLNRVKEYALQNKDKIKLYMREYHAKHK